MELAGNSQEDVARKVRTLVLAGAVVDRGHLEDLAGALAVVGGQDGRLDEVEVAGAEKVVDGDGEGAADAEERGKVAEFRPELWKVAGRLRVQFGPRVEGIGRARGGVSARGQDFQPLTGQLDLLPAHSRPQGSFDGDAGVVLGLGGLG